MRYRAGRRSACTTGSPARRRRRHCSTISSSASRPTRSPRRVHAAPDLAHSSSFYSTTLKNFATPWTNRDQTVFAPLNDYTATVIGMVRDDVDFRSVLSADLVYVGQGISPAYSTTSNAHYEALESNNADLRVVLAVGPRSPR